MTATFEIVPDVEQAAKTQAEARGIKLEDYLPVLVAQVVHDTVWHDITAARQTMLATEPAIRRLWDTPEEDEAWRDL
jgi:hypothetical protein